MQIENATDGMIIVLQKILDLLANDSYLNMTYRERTEDISNDVEELRNKSTSDDVTVAVGIIQKDPAGLWVFLCSSQNIVNKYMYTWEIC